MTQDAQQAQALNSVADTFTEVADQLDKATTEIVNAIGANNTPQTDAAVVRLQGLASRLKGESKALDDLNQDAAATGGSDTGAAPAA